MKKNKSKNTWLLLTMLFFIILFLNTFNCKSQSITIGISPYKSGSSVIIKGNDLVGVIDIGTYNTTIGEILHCKTGIGLSIDNPDIFGTCENISIDMILCHNYYSKEPPLERRDFTMEIGFHILPRSKIASSFHYDIINCQTRFALGINLNNIKMNKKRKSLTESLNENVNSLSSENITPELLELDEKREITIRGSNHFLFTHSLEKEQKNLIKENPYNHCFPI